MNIKPWLTFITGLIIGLLAAALQAYFQVQPPVALGVCFLGHPAMMIKSLMNDLFGTHLAVIEVLRVFPAALMAGLFIGAYVAAYRNGELAWRSGPVRNPYRAILFGFLAVNFGLLWGACPIRTGLLIAYGDIMAVIALFSLVVGVILACMYVNFRTRKGVLK